MANIKVVRLIISNPTAEEAMLLEQLRYAQLITVHRDATEADKSVCVDLHCPRGLDSATWARMNAERINTFAVRYNAAVAPTTWRQ